MIALVRVDDRLVHGQVVCAWVPHVQASSVVFVSEYEPEEVFVEAATHVCSGEGIEFKVFTAREVVEHFKAGDFDSGTAILILNDLGEALKLYEEGYRFESINIGNIHHNRDGRALSRSVMLNESDDAIIEKLRGMGVEIDIRALPGKEPVPYIARRR
ncbi:MAG: PTS sugar transporter subunit IIB [Deltaproteobacteria bacterium]|nr:PTS sugar transporter subunit IIB [Deltaproteobacteria bacterium]